jgi:hypothetical protein
MAIQGQRLRWGSWTSNGGRNRPSRELSQRLAQPDSGGLEPIGSDRQRDPKESFTGRPKGAAWQYHHSILLQGPLGKGPGAGTRGERHPEIHGGLGPLDREAGLRQRRYGSVSASLQLGTDWCHQFHLKQHGVPRFHHLFELTVVYFEKIGIILPVSTQVNGKNAAALGQCLYLQYTRHDGIARKMPLEEPFFEGHIFYTYNLCIA